MSSKEVGIEEARKVLGDLVRAAQQGTDIVITRNRKPVARLIAYQEDTMTKIEMPDDWTIPEHYTAHVIVDPAHTPGEYCIVSVTQDRVSMLGEVTWGDDDIWKAEITSVEADDSEDADLSHAADDAERLLTEAGWRVIGEYGWQPADWGWYQRVERVNV